MSKTQRRYIRMSDLQEVYGISRSTAYRAVQAGKLKIRKFGGSSLLKIEELDAMIEGEAEAAEV
ncbi:DNA-binding protein [Salipiger sp. IMCC34102]|uniref:helix-turn-helix transcriptional regulator n=1 Tax=Salipiger sp. IMCC34102 TaxID=2510647 RepID=UPI00101C79C0|nr:helix-turn-helix domain-containing protein [Salipiger sp. IMCC34102]RYH04102.1 DNA-binding protein [Salipiger sp. IMCC34102]